MNKCIFLDRDGVINKDYVDYVYTIEKFEFLPRVKEAFKLLKDNGYLLIVITNQSGVVKEIYKESDVWNVHNHIQSETDNILDDIYYAPYHENWTNSLTRKPGSLMIERAMAKYDIDPEQSWMIGDKKRDLLPAIKLGINTGLVAEEPIKEAKITENSLYELALQIVS